MEVIGFIATCPTYLLTKMPCLYNRLVTCDSFQNVLPRRGGFQSYPPSSCLHFLRITALVGCVLRIWLGLPPSSTCALHIEGNDRPETSCRTEGIDSRPVSLQEFLQPARLALSFSATSIRHSHRGTDEQPDQSRLVMDQQRFSPLRHPATPTRAAERAETLLFCTPPMPGQFAMEWLRTPSGSSGCLRWSSAGPTGGPWVTGSAQPSVNCRGGILRRQQCVVLQANNQSVVGLTRKMALVVSARQGQSLLQPSDFSLPRIFSR